MQRRTIGWLFTGGGALVGLAVALVVVLALAQMPTERASTTAEDEGEAAAVEVDTEVNAATPPRPLPAEGEPEQEPLEWDRPRFEARKEERLAMVRTQMARRGIKDEDVLEAMRQVPRHRFVPDDQRKYAHADRPLPIGQGQTVSQPYIVAFMTDLLDVEAGDKVLEIGTGSAYQAAVLSELTPYVYSIEIIRTLARQAGERLDGLGYRTVQTKRADGYYGWEEHAPFDAIIVTAAAGHVPPPLVKQLKAGGKMVIPVGGVYETQHLVVVSKDEDGRVRSRSVLAVLFVPMTGRAQRAE